MTLFNCKHGVVFMGRIVIVETGLFVTIKPVKFWFVLPGNLVVYSFFDNNNKKEHENPSKKILVQIEGMEVDENPPKSITNQCVFFCSFYVLMNRNTRKLSKFYDEMKEEMNPHFLKSDPIIEEENIISTKLDVDAKGCNCTSLVVISLDATSKNKIRKWLYIEMTIF